EPDIVTRNWAFDTDRAIRTYVSKVIPVTERMAWFSRELGGQLKLVAPFRLNWKLLPGGNWDSGAGNRKLTEQNARNESDVIAQSYFKDKDIAAADVARWGEFLRSLTSLNHQIELVYFPVSPALVTAGQPYADIIRQNLLAFDQLAKANGVKLIKMTAA